ncbi:MAG: hypothetical protein RL518_2656 [Pseudomonadota bacterium]
MNVLPARANRVLLAAALGLAVAIIGALSIEQAPSAAIVRGDFPAFYTMAIVASRGEGARLYDLETQRLIQNEFWPSLNGSVLPVAYPAFLAFCLEPLAALPPNPARLLWTVCMVLCVVMTGALAARTSASLRGLTWQVVVSLLLFAPLFLGVLGGQIVGLSVLLYAALFFLDRKPSKEMDLPIGVIAGLWMYKPHFALSVVVVFLAQRRWRVVGAWLVTCVALWSLGASVAGVDWLSRWYSFADGFAHIDLVTNAPHMTGVVPFLYVISGWFQEAWSGRAEMWNALTLLVALIVPTYLFRISRRGELNTVNPGLIAVGPLLVLFAPAVNFYDLALGMLPLVLMFRSNQSMDHMIGGALLALSYVVMFLKDGGVAGGSFVFAILSTYLVIKATGREGVQRS